jgi:uncharacterized protein (DUF3820 family)
MLPTSVKTSDPRHSALRMVMPFGRYEDQRLADVPRSYLYWALSNVDLSGRPELHKAIRVVLGLSDLSDAIERWYAELRVDYTLDGDPERGEVVREAHTRLRHMLGLGRVPALDLMDVCKRGDVSTH